MGRRLDAETLAQAMLRRAAAELPVVYTDDDPRNVEAHLARDFLLHVCRRAYGRLLADPDFTARIAPDLWRGLFEAVDELRDAVDALPNAIRREVEPAVARLRDELGAKDRLILGFIRTATRQEVAADQIEATLFEMAVEWRGARGKAEGGALANLTPDLSALRAEAQVAHDANDVERFWTLLTDLERREAAALTAAHVETKRRAVAVAVSRLDAEGSAKRIAEIVALEVMEPAARFEALLQAWHHWYLRGCDHGLNFDLAVSIELARIASDVAADADQRGRALNDLGVSLQALGEREAGTARLEEAIAPYRAALEEWTRERVPLDWARTQANIGLALQALGLREAGTARLEEAVEAYPAALDVWTRERVPLDWARTQTNLGNALQALGQREVVTARLEEAVEAHRASLEERSRERVPLDWAATQANLGDALLQLGLREAGTARLEEAITASRAALEELTRERAPIYWANARGNQAVAMAALAERIGDAAIAAQAVAQMAEAEAVLREGGHAAGAAMFERQLPAARALADRLAAR